MRDDKKKNMWTFLITFDANIQSSSKCHIKSYGLLRFCQQGFNVVSLSIKKLWIKENIPLCHRRAVCWLSWWEGQWHFINSSCCHYDISCKSGYFRKGGIFIGSSQKWQINLPFDLITGPRSSKSTLNLQVILLQKLYPCKLALSLSTDSRNQVQIRIFVAWIRHSKCSCDLGNKVKVTKI